MVEGGPQGTHPMLPGDALISVTVVSNITEEAITQCKQDKEETRKLHFPSVQ